jgi:hypothetical protein
VETIPTVVEALSARVRLQEALHMTQPFPRLAQQPSHLTGDLVRALQVVEDRADLLGAGRILPQIARVLSAVAAPAQLVERPPPPALRGDEALSRQRLNITRRQPQASQPLWRENCRNRTGGSDHIVIHRRKS